MPTSTLKAQPHPDRLVFDIGYRGHADDARHGMSLQFQSAHYAVPIALRLVGHAMRVLANAHMVDAVIHLHFEGIIASIYYIRCNIVFVRH